MWTNCNRRYDRPHVRDASVADYLARRNPAVDRLLPAGAGGTRFYEDLGGNAGLARSGSASIALQATSRSEAWPESVELHERAHLIQAFLPRETLAVLEDLPAAAPDEYAATNRGEQFAEMAAKAWEIVSPPDGFCAALSPADTLREAEARVPGTAGFVDWYLREPSLAAAHTGTALPTLAAELIHPRGADWDALWRALEARRLANGAFVPWRHASIRAHLEARRAESLAAGGWRGTLEAALLAPSLAILTLAGR